MTSASASQEGGHGIPKWAVDNRAKQLNPNNFRYHGPNRGDGGSGASTASKESGRVGMPKWAQDNRAKQLNPNNFRYRGPMSETKESS
ncbi:hypothetical protein PF005_g6298 [Phytophthora fragariae]|nr:hypothetical protein PF003_g2467 [Phytophthora fragariae]KAE9016906.1 hypothetical protein PF011_g6932 [Phytophthora fragariae]KAE9120931.1 hypothetical protein PF010_g7293 [Phytophthora fragariae]KAE9125230.1 hypothetical protein PF007_g6440 [Phytophthora fragariae]KAE9223457.1 hypothetical protein PF005_g6298 [Phytophthora fragariae]